MPIHVSYMGTKRSIAPLVAAVVEDAPRGPLLDLFSGICAIGSEVAPSRQVWCNDIQIFASTVAQSFFTSPYSPIHFDEVAELAHEHYLENYRNLENRFASALRKETNALKSRDLQKISPLENLMPNVASKPSLEKERARLAEIPEKPYRLFTITFSGGYLGLHQCIQVDSIRYAVDRLQDLGRFDEHQHRWMCLALCQAVSKASTTTGHFAQYMKVKEGTVGRFTAQRRRSIWKEWLRAIFEFSPVGSRAWRAKNLVFRENATQLLTHLRDADIKPAVIYADPPYTSDHYSRYYHLYETLLLYDYPTSKGVGRYRDDRFVSPFSIKTQVEAAMDSLVANCAALGSRLVLSYPERGLLSNAEETIASMLHEHFGSGRLAARLDHFHSSLGGSKGQEKNRVKELIFAAGM